MVAGIAVGHLDDRGRPLLPFLRCFLVRLLPRRLLPRRLRRRFEPLWGLQRLWQVLRVGIVLPVDRERGGVGVQSPDLHAERSARPQRQPREQPRHVVLIQPVQGASQTVVVEVLGQDPRPQQMLHRFVGEELRHEIQPAIAEAQSVQDQRDGRRPHAHLLSVGGVLLVQPVRHSDLPTDLRDDAQMVEMFDDKL